MTEEQIENPDPIDDLKGLEWQVNIRHRDLYYVGRGLTPTKALADLTAHMEKGISHVEEQLETFKKRYDALKQALADIEEDA